MLLGSPPDMVHAGLPRRACTPVPADIFIFSIINDFPSICKRTPLHFAICYDKIGMHDESSGVALTCARNGRTDGGINFPAQPVFSSGGFYKEEKI